MLFALRGAADPELAIERFPHHWVYLGQIGKIHASSRAPPDAGTSVFIGSLVRPSLWQIRPDLDGLQVAAAGRSRPSAAATITCSTGMAQILEQHGFRLLGAHEVAPEIKVPQGALGRAQRRRVIVPISRLGFDYLRAAGPFDVGQAVAVIGKHVRGGGSSGRHRPDAGARRRDARKRPSARCKRRRRSGQGGKAGAGPALRSALDRAADRSPASRAAGLAGIAVIAGETIIAEPEEVVRRPTAPIFLSIGVAASGP